MNCPSCPSRETSKRIGTTDLGYGVFRCPACRRKHNERTGTPFNHLEFPTDIVFQVVLCARSGRAVPVRGFTFTHKAAREWEERFARLFAEQLRRKRRGQVGRRWFVDETYLKVKGKWCYLYRAIDRQDNLVDSMLSTIRDMVTTQQFFRQTLSAAEEASQQVTTDGHDSYPRAIRKVLGSDVEHQDNADLNRRLEQDHRGIKQRYYPTLGFGAFRSAQRFCSAFEEVRQYFRPRCRQKQFISLARQRQMFVSRVQALQANFRAH